MNIRNFQARIEKLELSRGIDPFANLRAVSDDHLEELIDEALAKLGGRDAALVLIEDDPLFPSWMVEMIKERSSCHQC